MLLLSIDTLRADALGVAGEDAEARTPFLDRLAGQGTYVAHARSHVPLTLPSHATMLTGLLPPAHGLHDNAPFALAEDTPTLATRLAAEGYHTAGVVGGAPLARQGGLARGFTAWRDPPATARGSLSFGERTADQVTQVALELLAEEPDDPTFLFAHYFDAHQPYAPPSRFASPDDDPRTRYRGEVQFVDEQVGRLLEALARDGRRWLVAVTSDHGEGLGDHGEDTHGYFVFDSTMDVPLILAEIQDHRVEPWSVLPHPDLPRARLVDLSPTVLGRLGLEPLPGCQGMDLAMTKGLSPPAYVESLAANLHFGWAQITGVHTHRGTLLWSGSTTAPEPLPDGVIRGPRDGECLMPASAGESAEDLPLESWRDQLVGLRRERDAGQGSGLEALVSLGYLTSSDDAARHLLLAPQDNNALPSALQRVPYVARLLNAVRAQSQGDAATGLRDLRSLALQDPDNPSALFFLARGSLEQARRRKDQGLALAALDQLEELLLREPGHPSARLLRIQALGLCGRFGPAIEAARALCEQKQSAAHQHLLGSLLVEGASLDRSVANPHRDLREGAEHLLRAVEAGALFLAEDLLPLLDHPDLAARDPSWPASARRRLEAATKDDS